MANLIRVKGFFWFVFIASNTITPRFMIRLTTDTDTDPMSFSYFLVQ